MLYLLFADNEPKTRCIKELGKAAAATIAAIEFKAVAAPLLTVYNTNLSITESLCLKPTRLDRKSTTSATARKISVKAVIAYIAREILMNIVVDSTISSVEINLHTEAK